MDREAVGAEYHRCAAGLGGGCRLECLSLLVAPSGFQNGLDCRFGGGWDRQLTGGQALRHFCNDLLAKDGNVVQTIQELEKVGCLGTTIGLRCRGLGRWRGWTWRCRCRWGRGIACGFSRRRRAQQGSRRLLRGAARLELAGAK